MSLQSAVSNLQSTTSSIASSIGSGVRDNEGNLVVVGMDTLVGQMGDSCDFIGTLSALVGDGLRGTIQGLQQNIADIIGPIADIANQATQIIGQVQQQALQAVNRLVGQITSLPVFTEINAALDWLNNLTISIPPLFQDVFAQIDSVVSSISNVVSTVQTQIGNVMNSVSGAISGIIDAATGIMNNISRAIGGIGCAAVNSVVAGLGGATGGIPILDNIQNVAENGLSALEGTIGPAVQGMADAAQGTVQSALNTASSLGTTLQSEFASVSGQLESLVGSLPA